MEPSSVGIVCGSCDGFSPLGTTACIHCGQPLSLAPRLAYLAPSANAGTHADAGSELSEEELMEQARNYVCRECASPVASGHKFCGTCGAAVPVEVVELRTRYFGAMQTPGKARLILIRGDSGVDGLSYMLQGSQHVAGREDGQILFPGDPLLSPRHANFAYDSDGKLVVHDEESLNGVYVRVKGSVPLVIGQTFLCGEQLLRLDAPPEESGEPEEDQTYFFSSPRKPIQFCVTQILVGGAEGTSLCCTGTRIQIGREECDFNFPLDVYMSGRHAHVECGEDGSFSLTDDGSKNGTYLRVQGSAPLGHGDYLFLGKQLLRVEMTA